MANTTRPRRRGATMRTAARRRRALLDRTREQVTRWLARHSIVTLRVSLGLVAAGLVVAAGAMGARLEPSPQRPGH